MSAWYPTDGSEQLDAARELPAVLKAREWDGGVRVIVQGAMRAPIRNGQVSLEAHWRADVFYTSRQRRPSFTLVAESAEQLFTDLAALSAGQLEVQANGQAT